VVAMACARKDRNGPMIMFSLILFCVILCQTIGAAVFLVWIKDTYSLEAKTYKSLGGEEGSKTDESTRLGVAFIDDMLQDSMQNIESYTCNTYRKCCWTGFQHTGPEDFGNLTCTQGHSGVTVGAAAQELTDPSSHRFCEMISGTKKGETPIFAVCKGMERAGIFTTPMGDSQTLEECQSNFCDDGKGGYERFVTNTFGWLRENFEYVFVIMLIFAVGESTLMVVSITIILISKQAAASAQKIYMARHPEYRGNQKNKNNLSIGGAGASMRHGNGAQVVGTL
jgi:hypothetical protein